MRFLIAIWLHPGSIPYHFDLRMFKKQDPHHLQELPPVIQELVVDQRITNAYNTEATINDIWEDTLRMPLEWMDGQDTDQFAIKIKKLAQHSSKLNSQLLTTLINKGEDNICYKGRSFFAHNHSEGNGTNSNKISSGDYSELKIKNPENPTVAEMRGVIPKVIQHMFGFKNDKGEIAYSDAKSFLVMVPFNMMGSTMSSIYGDIDDPLAGSNREQKFNITGVANRLLTQSNSFFVFRSDTAKPFFVREEGPIIVSADEGHIENNELLYRITRSCIAGYGLWQFACKATFSAI